MRMSRATSLPLARISLRQSHIAPRHFTDPARVFAGKRRVGRSAIVYLRAMMPILICPSHAWAEVHLNLRPCLQWDGKVREGIADRKCPDGRCGKLASQALCLTD